MPTMGQPRFLVCMVHILTCDGRPLRANYDFRSVIKNTLHYARTDAAMVDIPALALA